MIGLGWIPWCRSNAAISLGNEVVAGQIFVCSIAPLIAHALMQLFGKSFRQPVG